MPLGGLLGAPAAHTKKTVYGGVFLSCRFFRLIVVLLLLVALFLAFAVPVRAAGVVAVSLVTAAVIAALAAWGISTVVDDLSQQSVADYFNGELDSWASSEGSTVSDLIPPSGLVLTPLGAISADPIASSGISLFARWYASKYNISSGGTEVLVYGGSSFPQQSFPYVSSELTGEALFNSSVVYFAVATSDAPSIPVYHYAFSSPVPNGDAKLFLYLGPDGGYNLRVASPVSGQTLRYVQRYIKPSGSAYFNPVTTISASTYDSSYHLYVSGYRRFSSPSSPIVVNNIPIYDTLDDGLAAVAAYYGGSVDAGSLTVQPSDVIGIPSVEDLENGMVLDFGGAIGLTKEEVADQILTQVISNTLVVTSDVVGAGDVEAPAWPDVTRPIGVSGLSDIFPFCIPFDIYHFFQALAAEPVAPHFEIPFVIDGLVDHTFVIDLSDFDQAAQILRTLELLAFCVGLALVTRSMMIRG